MKNINIVLEDREHEKLEAKKGDMSWRQYILKTLEQFDREEWKDRVIGRLRKEGIKASESELRIMLDIAAEELRKV